MFGNEALDLGVWLMEHPVTTGVLLTLAMVMAGALGFWYERRRDGS